MALMANPNANTYVPGGPGGDSLEEEEVRDLIEMITPEETPMYSNLAKGTTHAINTEWGTVTLPTIVTADAEKRGFVASLRAAIVPERLNNYCQLAAETGTVADTYDAIDLYGREDESDFQMLLKGRFLRRKVNKLLYKNQARTNVEPTLMSCFPSWIRGGNFVSIATTPGTPGGGEAGSAAYTPGTTPNKLASVDPIDDAMEAAYLTNGQPQIMFMHPSIKRTFSRLPDASVAENRINMTAGTPKPFMFTGVVDVYLTDFGLLETAIDRDADISYIAMVDPDMVELATLPGRVFKKTPLAKVGSSTDFMMEWEGTLRVWNPQAHAMVEGTKAG